MAIARVICYIFVLTCLFYCLSVKIEKVNFDIHKVKNNIIEINKSVSRDILYNTSYDVNIIRFIFINGTINNKSFNKQFSDIIDKRHVSMMTNEFFVNILNSSTSIIL